MGDGPRASEAFVMDRRLKKKPQRSLARSFVVTVAVGIPAALLAGTGCSSANAEASGGGGGKPPQPQPGVEDGPCATEGAQRACHVNLGKLGGGQFQSCFAGTQTCTGGRWSGCGGDGTVTNSLMGAGLGLAPASAGGARGGIHTLGGGGCGNGICGAGNVCSGGADDGNVCLSSATCAGAVACLPLKTCVGGSDGGDTCVTSATCGGGGACTGVTEDCASCPADCGPCAPGPPSGGVSICTTDPCNPDCQGWSQPVPISSASGVGATIIGVSGFGQINNGQIKKLLLDNANTGTKCDDFATPGLPSSYYNCQIDTYCQMTQLGGDGNCHQFPASGVQGTDVKAMGTNAGADVTIGPGCSDTESFKYRFFPICNRGATTIPVGTVIRVKYFSPNTAFSPCQDTSCTAAAGWDCSLLVGDATSKNGSTSTSGLPLAPGTCQLLDTQEVGRGLGGATCSQPNGDKWMYVNCDGGGGSGVAEGTIVMKPGAGPTGVTAPPDSEPTTTPGTLGCANNWTDHSSNNNPPSCGKAGQSVVTFANDYHATCPVGFGVLWSNLIYDTTCPKNGSGTAEVFFEAATAPDVSGAPGAFSSFYEIGEAQHNNGGVAYAPGPGSDPEKCSFTQPFAQTPGYTWNTCSNAGPGPNPNCCPKSFQDQFQRTSTPIPPAFPGADPVPGALLARNDWMRLKVTVKATPDNKANATVNNWSVSYRCIARE